jgi:hypothetical protein
VLEATFAVFVSVPAAVGLTVTTILLLLPAPNDPIEQAMLEPRFMQPGEAETNVTLLGRESVTVTLDAESAPQLATTSVNERFWPTTPGSGAALCVTPTSALGAQHWKAESASDMESTNHPVPGEVLTPVAHDQRSWIFCPAAAEGRTAVVVTQPPELPPQACAPPSGFPVPVVRVQLYPPELKLPPAARIPVNDPPPIEISSTPPS